MIDKENNHRESIFSVSRTDRRKILFAFSRFEAKSKHCHMNSKCQTEKKKKDRQQHRGTQAYSRKKISQGSLMREMKIWKGRSTLLN